LVLEEFRMVLWYWKTSWMKRINLLKSRYLIFRRMTKSFRQRNGIDLGSLTIVMMRVETGSFPFG
jgi:hypothetical protein